MGYLWALVGFGCIGSYMLPLRFSTTKGFSFFHLMGWGLLIIVLLRWNSVALLWAHPQWFWAALLSGILWGVGQITANLALDEISLAKGVVYFNFNTLLNIVLGLVIFHEAASLQSLSILLFGALLLSAGALWVTKISAAPSKEGNLKKGVWLSLVTGFFWGIYFLPITLVRQNDAQAPISQLDVLIVLVLGGAITALLIPIFQKPKGATAKNFGLGLASAIFWVLGMSGMLMAIQMLGLSRAVPIVNASSLVYAAWSLFVFKELRFSEWPKVLGSALLALAGGILMALSN
jgi:glucose uptake protein GlcU